MLGVDRRAVSTAIGYALTLGIATILTTGLVVAGGTFLEDQREETVRNELTVVGQQLAADMNAADRLARTSTGDVRIERSLPDRVVGSSYRIEVMTATETRIHLSAVEPDVTVVIDVETRTPLVDSTAQGGDVEIVYTGSALEVQNG